MPFLDNVERSEKHCTAGYCAINLINLTVIVRQVVSQSLNNNGNLLLVQPCTPQVYVCGVHCAVIAVPVTLMLCFYLVPGVRSLVAKLKSR